MTAGYTLAIVIGGSTLFFVLLWAFGSNNSDDTAWVSAGLAAGVVMLLAAGTREVFFRRSNARRVIPTEHRDSMPGEPQNVRVGGSTAARNTAALRNLQKLSGDADSSSAPESHLEAFHACTEYLENTEEILRASEISRESRAAVRSGQERVRGMQRHHMLAWARAAVRLITQEAQQRVRLSDKIETAGRGLTVIKTAQQHYPEEKELIASADAIQEFIVSAQVAHWVELAERNAFRGYYKRSIDRYHDALFYLKRGKISGELQFETAERIRKQIDILRTRLRTSRQAGLDTNGQDETPNMNQD